MKKAHAMMEFMMNYGWVILLLIFTAAVLLYYSVAGKADSVPGKGSENITLYREIEAYDGHIDGCGSPSSIRLPYHIAQG